MTTQSIVITVLIGLSGLSCLVVAIRLTRLAGRRLAKLAAALSLGTSTWLVGYGVEVWSRSESVMLWSAKAQYVGISTVALSWFLLAAAVSGRAAWLDPRRILPLLIEPGVIVVLVATGLPEGWVWRQTEIAEVGRLSVLKIEHGPAFWAHVLYSNWLMLVGTVWLVGQVRRGCGLLVGQARYLMTAAIAPWLANIVYVSGLGATPFDYTPVAFGVSSLLIVRGLRLHRLFGVVSTGRPLAFECLRNGVLIEDSDGHVVDLNAAAARMLSVVPAAALGSKLPALLPPGVLEGAAGALAQPDAEGETCVLDGDSGLALRIQTNPIRQAGGARLGRIVVLYDESAEMARREIQSSYQTLLENLPVGAFRNTAGRTGRFLMVNPALVRMFGYERAEQLLATPVADLYLDPSQRAGFSDRLVEAGVVLAEQEQFRRSDGSVFWGEVTMRAVRDDQGRVRHFDGVVEDITERRAAEEDLRAANAAALVATRAKSQFLANMSHEVRTPLSGIIGMAELLADRALDAESHQHIDTINSCATALLSVVNDILDFSTIEADQVEMTTTDFDPRELVGGVVTMLSPGARGNGSILEFDVDAQVPATVQGDVGRMRQILINLVGNAVKFTQEGRIDVRISMGTETAADPSLRFEVQDSGIGIPAEFLPRLFDPFSQQDSSMTRAYGGTGLGLAISSRLARLLGGEIDIVSELGEGSTFAFTVPVAASGPAMSEPAAHGLAPPSEPTNVPPPTPPTPPADGATPANQTVPACILVAEDNPVNQRVAVALLRKLGYSCDVVPNGYEALCALAEQRYDAVLMDAQMPVMDGLEATRQIRHDDTAPWAMIPIIALTARALKGDREECLAAGMNDYLSKPVSADRLATTLHRWIDDRGEPAA